jgi:hypothetical protein
MQPRFELLLFADSAPVAAAATDLDGLVVDWESRGKAQRQAGYDTQVNHHTLAHLRQVRAATSLPVTCRINSHGPHTLEEVEAALGEGANEILLPMVRQVDEVERTLQAVRGRAPLAILIETTDAVQRRAELGALPLSRIYVGLNDLAIDRGARNIFTAVVDGTVEDIRGHIRVPFGFGGLTLPHLGHPVPCHLLIAEMARLRCSFSFLRRSFLRDVPADQFGAAALTIRKAMVEATTCSVGTGRAHYDALGDAAGVSA